MNILEKILNEAIKELDKLCDEFAEIQTNNTVKGITTKDKRMESINKRTLALGFKISMINQMIGDEPEEEKS